MKMCFRVCWTSPNYTFVTSWDEHYTPAFREHLLEAQAKTLTADYGETFVVGGHSGWLGDIQPTLYRNVDGLPVCMVKVCTQRGLALAHCFVCGYACCPHCLVFLDKASREERYIPAGEIALICQECFAS